MNLKEYPINRIKYMLAVLGFMILAPAAGAAPTIDGDPSDWGPAGFLTGDWTLNDTWLPKGGIPFIVDDNRNPKLASTYTGVHIFGIGGSYQFYDEPKGHLDDGTPIVQPLGGEGNDHEAMYFQQNDTHVFLLLVTSTTTTLGDLRIDVTGATSGDGWPQEMGVKLRKGSDQFKIFDVDDWFDGLYIVENRPGYIVSGTVIGDAEGKIVACSGCNNNPAGEDYGKPNYIIELAIPKAAIGIPIGPNTAKSGDFSLSESCANDEISIPIPEFILIAMPLVTLLGLIYVLKTKRSS